MDSLISTLALGAAIATATTFDDNLYLTLFFSRVNRRFRPRHIVVGEFLGFSVLVLISLSGVLLSRMVDTFLIGLLGFLPLGIGLHALLTHRDAGDEARETAACSRPLPPQAPDQRREGLRLWRTLRDAGTYRVAGVTIANGGNNIAIYIPLFASSSLPQLLLILLICYGAIGLWCFSGWLLLRQPQLAGLLCQRVSRIAPFVLIWLGVSILLRNGTPQAIAALAGGA